jgi:hypothetical protein
MDSQEWFEKVEEISDGNAFMFHDELCKLLDEGASPEDAWAQVSEGWSADEAISPVAAMLANMGVPMPKRD